MSEPTKPRRLYLVDGSSYLHRAFHASAPLTTKNGLPTNGLLVFTNMLRALMRTEALNPIAHFDACYGSVQQATAASRGKRTHTGLGLAGK